MPNERDGCAPLRRDDHDGAARVHRERWFEDGAGVRWHAYERPVPGERAALVFESPGRVRLVRDYPENWYTLPPRALEALSWWV